MRTQNTPTTPTEAPAKVAPDNQDVPIKTCLTHPNSEQADAARAARREDWLATAEACRTPMDFRTALLVLIEEAYGPSDTPPAKLRDPAKVRDLENVEPEISLAEPGNEMPETREGILSASIQTGDSTSAMGVQPRDTSDDQQLTVELSRRQFELLSEAAAVLQSRPAEMLVGAAFAGMSESDSADSYQYFSESIRIFARGKAVPRYCITSQSFDIEKADGSPNRLGEL